MLTKLNLLPIALFIFHAIFSQTAPEISWQRTIGGSASDILYAMEMTADGGYILGGHSASDISGDKTEPNYGIDLTNDFWVIKLNSAGEIEWQNTIGGDSDDQLFGIKQTSDLGYILAGCSKSGSTGDKTEDNLGNYDYWLVKLNSAGNISWQKTIGSSGFDVLNTVNQTMDGGYIIGGRSDGPVSGHKSEGSWGDVDFWILKLDAYGNIEWQNTIGGNKEDYFTNIEQTTDGGYIVGGNSKSDITGDKTEAVVGVGDFWILKLDAYGNIEWQNTIGSNTKDKLNALFQTPDGGYIAGGNSKGNIFGDKTEKSFYYDYWILKLNASGNIVWQNTISGAYAEELNAVKQTPDGGFILGGVSDSPIFADKTEAGFGLYDYWIVKIDSIGNVMWDKTYGGSGDDYLYALHAGNDNNFFIAGYSNSGISGNKDEASLGETDYWVIKLGTEEDPPCSTTPNHLYADNILSSNAQLHWSADPDAIKYKVQYAKSTLPTWTNTNAPSNVKNLFSLEPTTTYKFRIKSLCDSGLSSGWSEIETFTTLPLREGNGEWSVLNSQSVNVFPNPNNGKFNLKIEGIQTEENISMRMFNLLGEEVYSETIENADLINHSIELNSTIENGFYLMEIKVGENIFTEQIIISR